MIEAGLNPSHTGLTTGLNYIVRSLGVAAPNEFYQATSEGSDDRWWEE